MNAENIIILVVFGLSALMVPVWLVLQARKTERERRELERRAYLDEQQDSPDSGNPGGSAESGNKAD